MILHQVLHYAQQPAAAIAEAARLLAPGGRLLVVDFAPHEREELRDRDAHVRLGFADEAMLRYLEAAGLEGRVVEHLEGGELTVTIWRGAAPRAAAEGGRMSAARIALAEPARRCSPKLAGDIAVSASNSSRRKTEKMEQTLWESIKTLEPLQPALRLGHLRRRRLDPRAHPRHRRADRRARPRSTPAAHLTCVDATPRARSTTIARAYWEAGVRHIVALARRSAASRAAVRSRIRAAIATPPSWSPG